MGSIAAIIGSGCCCDGEGEPCDCTLSAVTVAWSGNYHLGYTYDSESCGVPDAGFIAVYGELSVSSFEVVCEQRTDLFGCPYIGEYNQSVQLLKHSGGYSDYWLRVQFTLQVFRTAPEATKWKVKITISVAVTNADETVGQGYSCVAADYWDEWWFVNSDENVECPPFGEYDILYEGCYCCCDADPWCGGGPEVPGLIEPRPAQFECDQGSVSVS